MTQCRAYMIDGDSIILALAPSSKIQDRLHMPLNSVELTVENWSVDVKVDLVDLTQNQDKYRQFAPGDKHIQLRVSMTQQEERT